MKRSIFLLPALLLASLAAAAPHDGHSHDPRLRAQDPPPVDQDQPPEEGEKKPPEQRDHPPIEGEQPFDPVEAEEPKAVEGEEKKEEEPKWNVNQPPGPTSQVTIDTDEGTWMGLDVSPDGKEIVFDLLGDLYTVPIGGGEAKALTNDVAWQMQPALQPERQAHRLHQR